MIWDFLDIERAQLGDRLRWNLQSLRDVHSCELPPFSLRSLVHNSVKHVAARRPEGADIRVEGGLREGQLVLSVWDDGPGFDLAHALKGHGLDTLRLLDDIEAANLRLARTLKETGRVEVVGSTTQPLLALAEIPERDVDVLFLDVEMPGLDGFDLLRRLRVNPQVVFVTGHDEYARRAFDERAVDYLMKPVTRERLAQTLDTLEARRADPERERLGALLERLEGYQPGRPTVQYAERVSVDLGQGGVDLIDLATISHFVAQGRGTLAMTHEGPRLVNHPLGELENRLDPRKFCRIHRNVVVKLDWVQSIVPPRGGGLMVKLKDKARTELEVARERVRGLRERFVL